MIIKLTYPTSWHKEDLWSNFKAQTPSSFGIWENVKFEINNNCDECEYWVVIGNLNYKEKVFVKKETIFIPSEEQTNVKSYNPKFLAQFSSIATCRQDILNIYRNAYKIPYVCPWQIQKTFDEITSMGIPTKTKDLSAIISDMYMNKYHRKRFILMNKLKGHFKDKLDWYGKGNVYIKDKADGLFPYKYSIAIENSIHQDYWTEKISDCFLSYTMPIYFGCPNITDYFDKEAMVLLDNLDNFIEVINTVEKAIEENLYDKNIDKIDEARNAFLFEYQLFPILTKLFPNLKKQLSKTISLQPIQYYNRESFHLISIKKIYNLIK